MLPLLQYAASLALPGSRKLCQAPNPCHSKTEFELFQGVGTRLVADPDLDRHCNMPGAGETRNGHSQLFVLLFNLYRFTLIYIDLLDVSICLDMSCVLVLQFHLCPKSHRVSAHGVSWCTPSQSEPRSIFAELIRFHLRRRKQSNLSAQSDSQDVFRNLLCISSSLAIRAT